ncbi:MAG: LicD family protein [Muribaculaceae bacterium]|nr:LicD family protein [Muribaculaceae bacterium]
MIDEKKHNELRAKYNPDGSDLRKAQMVMLDLLVFLDKICSNNNLTYWLDGGTLLGAARHGGFIPWDDDVDVCMPREDAKKLKKIMGNSVFEGHIVLQNQSTDWNYLSCGWMKLRDLNTLQIFENNVEDDNIHKLFKFKGFQVDIFEVEEGLEEHGLRKWIKLFPSIFACYFTDGIAKRTNSVILRCIANFNARILNNTIIPFGRLFKNDNSIVTYAVGIPFFERQQKENIYPLKKISFENHSFNCPSNVNDYLKNLYVDWEQIPKEEEIKTHDVILKFLI